MKTTLTLLAALAFTLTACQKPSQDAYREGEVGVAKAIEYGTVESVRAVEIIGKNTGVGMLIGAGVGGGGASYVGNGSGQTWATAAGAVAGAVIGSALEQEISDDQGIEYTIRTDDGETKAIAQYVEEGKTAFAPGDRVMIQSCQAGDHYKKCEPNQGGYQRVLPAPPGHQKAPKAKEAKN